MAACDGRGGALPPALARAWAASLDALPSSVARVDARALPAAAFLARFAAPSLPAVLLGGAARWPALALWRDAAALAARARGAAVTLATTPDARADAAAAGGSGPLRLPREETLPLAAALAALGGARACGAAYVSAQNDSLRREAPALEADVCGAALAGGASDALGEPIAVNLWVSRGGPAPVSSWHRDHYHNLHTVVAGEKTFALLPPHAAFALRKRRVGAARWAHDDAACARGGGAAAAAAAAGAPPPSCWSLAPAPDALPPGEAALPWATPTAADVAAARPLVVRVRAGETLFLPALWYHEVTSGAPDAAPDDETLTIAVNAWYDAPALGGLAAAAAFTEALAAEAEGAA